VYGIPQQSSGYNLVFVEQSQQPQPPQNQPAVAIPYDYATQAPAVGGAPPMVLMPQYAQQQQQQIVYVGQQQPNVVMAPWWPPQQQQQQQPPSYL